MMTDVTEMDDGERENENEKKTERTGNEVTFRPTPRNYCKIARKSANVNSG